MKRITQQIPKQLGWQGMLGITLLVWVGAFTLLELIPLEHESTLIRNRLDAARSESVIAAGTFESIEQQKELEEFFDSLPVEDDVTDILGSIYSVARAVGSELKQADYQLDTKGRPRIEYRINFTVRGEYSRIREFLSRVLTDHLALALDEIHFQRDRIDDATLKVGIRLTLFLNPSK